MLQGGFGAAGAAGLLANSFDVKINPEKLAEMSYVQQVADGGRLKGNQRKTKNDYILEECNTIYTGIKEYDKYFTRLLRKSHRKLSKIVR